MNNVASYISCTYIISDNCKIKLRNVPICAQHHLGPLQPVNKQAIVVQIKEAEAKLEAWRDPCRKSKFMCCMPIIIDKNIVFLQLQLKLPCRVTIDAKIDPNIVFC